METSKIKSETEETIEVPNENAKVANLKPQIGRIYKVKRLDGQWHSAEVLEKRELKDKPTEYFVHFENCNKYF